MGTSTGATAEPESTGYCPSCATENDLFFTYCRNCLQELPSAAETTPVEPHQ